MYFIHSTISIQRYMPKSEESKSTASEYARPDALACQPPSLRPALRLQWASTLNLDPLDAAGSSAQHLLALPPREPLCVTTAQGDRCRRKRGVAHRDAPEPRWRAHHIGGRLGIDRGICGRRRPRAPTARRASPFAFANESRARSVRSGGMSTSLDICSINIFLLLHSGEDGWRLG